MLFARLILTKDDILKYCDENIEYNVARGYIQRNKKQSDKLIIKWKDLFNKIK